MDRETQLLRALDEAGAQVSSKDVYAIDVGPSRVYAVIGRGKNGGATNVALTAPIVAAGEGLAFLPELTITRETDAEHAAVAEGRARELQTGDAEFDRASYVRTDAAAHEITPVLAVPEVRRAVTRALMAGADDVEFRNGKRAAVIVGVSPTRFSQPGVARELSAALATLHAALPRFRSTSYRVRLGPAGLISRATLLLALPGLFAALSAAAIWQTTTDAIAFHAAAASVPLYVALVLLVKRRAPRGSTGPFRLRATILGGLLTVPAWTIAAAYTMNGAADSSVSFRRVELIRKWSSKSGKSTFLSARIGPSGPLKQPYDVTSLQSPTYDRLPERGAILAEIGGGRLGYPWVGKLRPIEE